MRYWTSQKVGLCDWTYGSFGALKHKDVVVIWVEGAHCQRRSTQPSPNGENASRWRLIAICSFRYDQVEREVIMQRRGKDGSVSDMYPEA